MEYEHICQSCGRPLDSLRIKGTEAIGTRSSTYCSHCYHRGAFIDPELTMVEMKSMIRARMREKDIPENLIHLALETLPKLKRWKSKAPVS